MIFRVTLSLLLVNHPGSFADQHHGLRAFGFLDEVFGQIFSGAVLPEVTRVHDFAFRGVDDEAVCGGDAVVNVYGFDYKISDFYFIPGSKGDIIVVSVVTETTGFFHGLQKKFGSIPTINRNLFVDERYATNVIHMRVRQEHRVNPMFRIAKVGVLK